MLHRGHHETICHEPCQSLEVERRWSTLRFRYHEVILRPWYLLIHLSDLDGEEVVFAVGVWVELFLALAYAEGGEGLGYGVCDATEDLFADILLERDHVLKVRYEDVQR
jgi:hypothetical protein